MSNKITVYWACLEKEALRAKEPVPIHNKILLKEKNAEKQTGLLHCPGFKEYTKNIFGLHSLYSYEFEIIATQLFGKMYNQEFFNEHVVLRSLDQKCFSFCQNFIFFTEEDELLMSAGIHPFLEDNEISKRCMVIPGTFDIGKWFRNIDFAFYLKEDFNTFKINEDDIFQYIKFDTDKKIVFKQFEMNDFLNKQWQLVVDSKDHRNKKEFRQLSTYYSMARNKKKIIKEIKNNLVN